MGCFVFLLKVSMCWIQICYHRASIIFWGGSKIDARASWEPFNFFFFGLTILFLFLKRLLCFDAHRTTLSWLPYKIQYRPPIQIHWILETHHTIILEFGDHHTTIRLKLPLLLTFNVKLTQFYSKCRELFPFSQIMAVFLKLYGTIFVSNGINDILWLPE